MLLSKEGQEIAKRSGESWKTLGYADCWRSANWALFTTATVGIKGQTVFELQEKERRGELPWQAKREA